MNIYMILLLISLTLLLLRKTFLYKEIIFKRTIFFSVFIFLFIIYVFRSINVGADYILYNQMFQYTSDALKYFNVEPAYIYINSIAQQYNNFLIVPSIIFLILFVGIYMLSKELKINEFTFLSLFILTYIYYDLFNIMRQFSALGIICIGLYFLLKLYNYKYIKYIIYILIVLFATLFHNTAIACILLIFLFKVNINKKIIIPITLFIPILYFSKIITLFTKYILILFPFYMSKYNNINISLIGKGNISHAQLFILIIESLFFLAYLYIIDYDKLNNYKNRFILNGYFIFLILATGSSNIMIGRIQAYFYLFQFLFSCIFIDKLSDKYVVIKLLYIIFIICFYLFQLISINNGSIVPYNFI